MFMACLVKLLYFFNKEIKWKPSSCRRWLKPQSVVLKFKFLRAQKNSTVKALLPWKRGGYTVP